MMKRPFATIGITYLVSQAVAVYFGLDISLMLAAISGMALIIYLFIMNGRRSGIIAVLISVIFSMGIYCAYYSVNVRPSEIFDGQTCEITGTITDCGVSYGRYQYVIDTESIAIEGAPQNVRMRLSSSYPIEADMCDNITTVVCFNQRTSLERSTEMRLLSRGITATAYIPKDTEIFVSSGEKNINRYFYSVRRAMGSGLEKLLPQDQYAMATAMMFGDKSELSEDVAEQFRACGLSHLFAVSGVHLSIIVSALVVLLSKLRIKGAPRNLIMIFGVLFMMGVAGFSFSVMRAGIMMIIALTASLIKRDADPINSLGAAVLLICVVNPAAAVDIGLQLSFSATLGILVLYPKIYGKLSKMIKTENEFLRRAEYYLAQSLSATLAATLTVVPVSSLYFGEVSLVAVPATVLCLAAASVFLVLCILTSLLALVQFLVPIATLVSYPVWLLGGFLLTVTKILSAVPGAVVNVGNNFYFVFVVLSAVFVLAWLAVRRGRPKESISFALCLALIVQMFVCGAVSQRVMSVNDSYIKVYNAGDGVAVAAVRGDSCIVVGTGGDEYLSYKMSEDIGDADVVFFPDTSSVYASNGDGFIGACRPDKVFIGECESASDDKSFVICNRAKELGCEIYSSHNAYYSVCGGRLSVEMFESVDGFVWTYVICDDLELLICPQDGDVLTLPQEWRAPDCAVINGDDIVNVTRLDSVVMIVSDEYAECADMASQLRMRGCGNVLATAIDGDMKLTSDMNGVRVECADD